MAASNASDNPDFAGLTQLLLWAPEGFEQTLGYAEGRRFVAFYWDNDWNDLTVDDGFQHRIGPQWREADGGEGDAWDDWRNQKMVENILAPYDLGDSGSPATHWLVLDRQTRQFSIAPAERAIEFLRQTNPEISEPAPPAAPGTSANPYPSEPLPKRKWDEYTI